jgi:hypothetical protein
MTGIRNITRFFVMIVIIFAILSCEEAGDSGNGTLTDEEAVAQDKASLDVTYASGDSASYIKNNLTLPAAGSNATTISWESDDSIVIGTDGTVSRPVTGSSWVTLTATISKGDASDTKEFADLKVIGQGYRIFVTSGNWNGNLGGISGADDKVYNDGNKPAGGSGLWKALISDEVARTISLDWVMLPAVDYYRGDGTTLIGTSNAQAVFDFPVVAVSTSLIGIWTGLEADWSSSVSNCTAWTATDTQGAYGESDATNSVMIYSNTIAGTSTRYLYGVEQ